jgi:hypothetical protein
MVPLLLVRLPQRNVAIPIALAGRWRRLQQMGRRNSRADRPHHAGWMKREIARLHVSARPPDPALDFDAFDDGGKNVTAIGADLFRECQHRSERRRQRVRRRRPHGLEIEHMHGRGVEQGGRNRRKAKTKTQR